MSEPELKQLDQRLLVVGYVVAVIGYGVLLIGVVRPSLVWLAARDRLDAGVTMLWLFSFGMLGAALINSGSRLRRAYRAGMQTGF